MQTKLCLFSIFLTLGCSLSAELETLEKSAGSTNTDQSQFNLFIGIQGSNSTSRVFAAVYDGNAGTVTIGSEAVVSTLIGGVWANSGLRSLAFFADGSLAVGGGNTNWAHIDTATMALAAPSTITMDAGNQLTGAHGMCTLPNGNLIVGQYSGPIYEYTVSGSYVQTFKAAPSHSLSDCAAVSNTRVFWVDFNGATGNSADVVVSDFSAGSWTETGRYVTAVELPAATNSSFYSIVSHTNGYIYAFPAYLTSARNKKILKCSASGTLTDCTLIGVDLPTIDATMNVITAARQVPGSQNEILFIASGNLKAYKLQVSDDAVSLVSNLSTQGLTNVSTIRNMLVKAP